MNSTDMKNQLLKNYPYRTELHAHTSPISRCSEIKPSEMAETYAAKGYDAIVITNHFIWQQMEGMTKDDALNEYIGNFEETRVIGEKLGLKVLLGAEIRFTENSNDYLIYGVDREVLSVCYDYLTKGVEVFRKEVKLENSVFLQAHPFRNGMVLCSPELLDGIESFNMHPGHNSRIGIASRYSKEKGFNITTAGSDFHHKNQNHEAVTALRTTLLPENSFDIANILKDGDYIFEIGENSLIIP